MNDKFSKTCQILSSIRCTEIIPLEILAGIFHGNPDYRLKDYDVYLLGFFEECSPDLIHKFMKENSISREEILNIFYQLPECGEKFKFKEALKNGDF